MKQLRLLAAFLFVSLAAQQANSLLGVWKVTKVTPSTGAKIASPQPGLYIFTAKHYSTTVNGTAARPKYPSRDKATDADIIKTFDNFTAQSGSYTTSGNKLSTRPIVAKNEYVMSGPENQYEFTVNGSTLTITGTPANGSRGQVTKLTKME